MKKLAVFLLVFATLFACSCSNGIQESESTTVATKATETADAMTIQEVNADTINFYYIKQVRDFGAYVFHGKTDSLVVFVKPANAKCTSTAKIDGDDINISYKVSKIEKDQEQKEEIYTTAYFINTESNQDATLHIYKNGEEIPVNKVIGYDDEPLFK